MSDAHLSGLFRLGRTPELRYTPSGEPVCTLALAYSYGRKAEGEQYRPSQWIEAALWGKRADALQPYLKAKGQIYAVLEDVRIENYERRDGSPGTKLSARVLEISLAGSAPEEAAPAGDGPLPMPQRAHAAPQQRQAAPAKAGSGSGFDDMDDDLPF